MSSPAANVGKNSLPLQIRIITNEQEPKFDSVIDRVESLALSALSASEKADSSLMCQIVKLMDHKMVEDITLPVSHTPCLLLREGRSYVSNPELDPADVERITSVLAGVVKTSERGRVIQEIQVADEDVDSKTLPADGVIYIPASKYHVRLFVSSENPRFQSESHKFSFFKEGSPLWTVQVCQGAHNLVSLFLSPATLHAQLQRMKAGQTHGFTLLTRDFIRNACALANQMGVDSSRKRRLFFPGVFDLSADVRSHYDTKMARFTSQEESAAGPIRKFNNLVKSCILAEYVPADSVVLDLACGHGQDLLKYKAKNPRLFVGTDIAQAALTEAAKRHREGRLRYPAEFIQGNLMLQDIFDKVSETARSHGILGDSQFDVVSIQLAIHYIIGNKVHADEFLSRVASLIKPGGRLIATFPCCERIANRLRSVAVTDETFNEFCFGNDLYKVTFEQQEILKLVPSLSDAVSGKSRDEVEAAITEVDREELMNAVSQTWGVKYKFWLVDTIDNQEEYMVPLNALQEGLARLGFVTEYTGNFAEIINKNTSANSNVIVDFRKFNKDLVLSDAEEDVFRFYRAAVFRKQ